MFSLDRWIPTGPLFVAAAVLLTAHARAEELPEGSASDDTGPVALSFEEAIALGIERNVRTRVSEQGIETAKGERMRSLSGLLPNVSGTVEQTRREANLVSVGLDPEILPSVNNGVFGPFNTFDARIYATQTIFDLTAIGVAQAGKASLDRAEVKYVLSTHLVFDKVGAAYVSVLEAQGAVDAYASNLELAKTLESDTRLAVDSGVATELDLARAQSRTLTTEVRLLEARTDLAVAQNKLKALLLLPQEEEVALSSALERTPIVLPDVDAAVRTGQLNRPDIKFSEATVNVTRYEHRAAIGQQVPAIGFGADYGGSGDTPSSNVRGTYLIGGVVSVPIYDGGNTIGAIKATRSKQYEAEQVLRQLKEDADEQVRSAIAAVEFTSQEVTAAAARVEVNQLALKLSRDRFFSGVNDNLELVAAQTSLADAEIQHIRALAKYNDSRIALAVALGVIDDFEF